MEVASQAKFSKRYELVSEEKAGGATYTPKILADFVAKKIVSNLGNLPKGQPLRILDPAIGHGELIVSLLEQLPEGQTVDVEVFGFETNAKALATVKERLRLAFPGVSFRIEPDSFLEFVLENFGANDHASLFQHTMPEAYDLIIANPPYVRTQIMGAAQARLLAEQFGLTGRVDLYYAFLLGMSRVLKPHGVAGVIVSNRFMTTKSGSSVRAALQERFNIRHAWDLGDTKLFDAAVLPAVLLLEGRNGQAPQTPKFTSIYQTTDAADITVFTPIDALDHEGIVAVEGGRRFEVQHGKLDTGGTSDGTWRVASVASDAWLATVEANTWGTFRDIGKIRVGVKTCADKIFIRRDWDDMAEGDRPELLKPLTTHHIARRYKARSAEHPRHILYPHEVANGRRRACDLAQFPHSKTYLESNRGTLESRGYVIEAGREWYEIWVPQDPEAWDQPKLVFRDIAEEPTFWIDLDGSVVNGDCYWLTAQNREQEDLLWLAAAVGNSSFIERFYDLRFNNKLYAGRRRFITQYVEKFPLPDPESDLGREIVNTAKDIYSALPSPKAEQAEQDLNTMVWRALTGQAPD